MIKSDEIIILKETLIVAVHAHEIKSSTFSLLLA